MDNTVGSEHIRRYVLRPVTTEVKNRNGFIIKNHYTPTSLVEDKRNLAEYITGYADGEGCFTVTFNKKPKALLKWEFRPSFSVSQNENRRQVLDLMQKYFECGYIRRDYSDKTVKFEVRDHSDLINKIIPHFEKFPFLSSKQHDFELFKAICIIVNRKAHLTKNGFVRILNLAYQMNGSGKRRRTKEEIIKSFH